VSKPVLFAHVGDRRALVRALGERLLARTDAAITEAISGAGGERAALERGIAAQLRTIARDRHVYAFVNADPTLAEMLAFARRTAAPLIKWIAARRKDAGQDASVADAWGIAIVGIRHMVGLWWLADRRRELDETRLAAQIVELLWSGLASSETKGRETSR
jgi:AcrR family transcriptional regulator